MNTLERLLNRNTFYTVLCAGSFDKSDPDNKQPAVRPVSAYKNLGFAQKQKPNTRPTNRRERSTTGSHLDRGLVAGSNVDQGVGLENVVDLVTGVFVQSAHRAQTTDTDYRGESTANGDRVQGRASPNRGRHDRCYASVEFRSKSEYLFARKRFHRDTTS